MADFASDLKAWRSLRRFSQLQLAAEAGVSSRHLAFLETGRARPSRGMVLRLADVLDLPHAALNTLLAAAGFAARYPALTLDDAAMAQVRTAMDWMIRRHEPYPALLMDRLWVIRAMNAPAAVLFGAAGFALGDSLLAAMEDMPRFTALIENWEEVGHHTLLRLRAESLAAGGIAELDRAAAALARVPQIAGHVPRGAASVILPTVYRAGPVRLPLFSTYARFGSAGEVELQAMKIELMFPADPQAEAALLAMAGTTA